MDAIKRVRRKCVMKELQYLVIGVEDGWIKVNIQIWEKYLKAKEILNGSKRYN